MKIYIVFNQKELSFFSSKIKKGDIILLDSNLPLINDSCVHAKVNNIDQKQLAEELKIFCEKISSTHCSFIGFSNNLYDCTVYPISAYLISLEKLLEKYPKAEVVLYKTDVIEFSKLNYFLGEYESQGQFLHDRSELFSPIIKKYLQDMNIKISVQKTNLFPIVLFKSLLRKFFVFNYKFFQNLLTSFQKNIQLEKGSADIYVISRSFSQFEFFKKIVDKSLCEVTFITYPVSFKPNKVLSQVLEEAKLNDINVNNISSKFNAFKVLNYYLRALFHLFTTKVGYVRFLGKFSLPMSNPIQEILIMNADLKLYEDSLLKTFSEIDIHRKIVLTGEQKSPHGYVDSLVAKQLKNTVFQVMQCDQEIRPLPSPIFSDYYLADTCERAALMNEIWSTDKVKYFGTIKAIQNQSNSNTSKTFYNYCFFPHLDRLEESKQVINQLLKTNLNFAVKLHPRDEIKNYKEFLKASDIKFISDDESSKDKLFSSFDTAITYKSAGVFDMFFNDKPFILINNTPGENWLYNDSYYIGYIDTISNLHEKIKQTDLLKKSFINFRHRYLEENNVIVSRKKIIEAIQDHS